MPLSGLWLLFIFLRISLTTGQNTNNFINLTSSCVLQTTTSPTGNIISLNSTSICNCAGTPFPNTLLNPSNTAQLTTINIPSCYFSGKIFAYINYAALIYVDVHNNNFSEQLPFNIYGTTTLTVFNIANNHFFGDVPLFSRTYSLHTFILANNSLTGPFQYVVPFAPLELYSIAGNQFYLNTSASLKFQFTGTPPYITNSGVSQGLKQIDCIYVLRGADVFIPNWCIDINNSGDSRCTCVQQCGNRFIEDTEQCDPPEVETCCDNQCHFAPPTTNCTSPTSCAFAKCGFGGACVPTGQFRPTSYTCRPSVGVCDAPENCIATSGDCPPDLPSSDTFTMCRPKDGICDVAEFCNGKDTTCPSDLFLDSSTMCRASNESCDAPEYCTGLSAYCGMDLPANNSVQCKSGSGVCVAHNYCTGTSFYCPTIENYLPGQLCKPANGSCDAPEYCDGKGPDCPTDVLEPRGYICRRATGDCDISETCSGADNECPPDKFDPPGTTCNSQNCYIPSVCPNGTTGQCPDLVPLKCAQGGFCNITNGDCQCTSSLLTYPNCAGCGDGKCGTLENCVNCPADCASAQGCNMCGDGFCGMNGGAQETCTTCYQDCNCTHHSICNPACVHGTCVDGACICTSPYTGPSCNNASAPININTNGTAPLLSVNVTGLDNAEFYISLQQIYEIDPAGNIWNPVNLKTLGYVLNSTVTSDYTFWNYTATVQQITVLQIYVIHFTNSTDFSLSGNEALVGANTLKMAIFVSAWPFRSTQNSLVVVFENDMSENKTCARQSGENSNKDLRWYKLSIGNTSLYAQLEDSAILDGYKKPITFTAPSATSVAAKIPFFWNNVTLDPNFSVLVGDLNPCSSFVDALHNSKRWSWFYIIPIVVVCVVCSLLLWKFEKLRLWNKLRSKPRLVVELDETSHSTSVALD